MLKNIRAQLKNKLSLSSLIYRLCNKLDLIHLRNKLIYYITVTKTLINYFMCVFLSCDSF